MEEYIRRIFLYAKVTITLVMLCFVTGCYQFVVTSDVQDNGVSVKTRYKYCYVGYYIEKDLKNNITSDYSAYPDWLSGKDDKDYLKYQKRLERLQPDVFASNGIPITIAQREKMVDHIGIYSLTSLCAIMTFCIFPGIDIIEYHRYTSIYLLDDAIPIGTYHLIAYQKNSVAISPLPMMLFYSSDPKISGYEDKRTFWSNNREDEGNLLIECSAHALATKLKELEDAGIINDNVALHATQAWATRNSNIASKSRVPQSKRQQQASSSIPSQSTVSSRQNPPPASRPTERQQPVYARQQTPKSAEQQQTAYSLESLKWDEQKDFECLFTVKMKGECSLEAFFDVQRKFVANLRDVYVQMHPGVNPNSLVVDVRPAFDNGKISGHASVLTITPTSLAYDANTRRGKLSVRFNTEQVEEARAWIRRNIETLARDKNIALTTGQLPPAATYYSLGEKIEGNVMEIEFKTE